MKSTFSHKDSFKFSLDFGTKERQRVSQAFKLRRKFRKQIFPKKTIYKGLNTTSLFEDHCDGREIIKTLSLI